nr:echicetin A-chain [Echis carinatus]1OZ7_A Chain A, echicetin A-chain [Echis carinatus]
MCPPGWSSNGVYCYMLFKEPKTWDEAEKFCNKQGKDGHLLSIESKKEEILVDIVVSENIGKMYKIWTGLSERSKEQHCSSRWSDGSFFRSYEIAIRYSECFVLEKQSVFRTWVATPCENTFPFMCKYPVPR